MPEFQLTVLGPPVGKGRAKARIAWKGRRPFVQFYTPAETREAEERMAEAWTEAGAVRLPEGGVVVDLLVVHERPSSHYLKGGELSAEGRRHPTPYRTKPDVDNVLKLALDALNGRAWADDVRVVGGAFRKTWGPRARVEFAARAAD